MKLVEFYYGDDENEKINEHYMQVLKREEAVKDDNKPLYTAIKKYIISKDNKYLTEIMNEVQSIDITSTKDIFTNGREEIIYTLLDNDYAKKYLTYIQHIEEYIYQGYYSKRSFRAPKNVKVYIRSSIDILRGFFLSNGIKFSSMDYLTKESNLNEWHFSISQIIAAEIILDNKEVIGRLLDIIYGDNNIGILKNNMIEAIIYTTNIELIKGIGDLLLAAKLQEGLRQAIVEKMDIGSKEAFLHLLNIINENNLGRFSSVVRAMSTWTGIVFDNQKPSLINSALINMQEFINNKDKLKEAINSNNQIDIYLALWAQAFDNVEEAMEDVEALANSNENYKIIVALYFLVQTRIKDGSKLALRLLDGKDLIVASYALNCIFPANSCKNNGEGLKAYYNNDEEAQLDFNRLKEILSLMSKKTLTFSSNVFLWHETSIYKEKILSYMFQIAQFTNEEYMYEFLMENIKFMSVYEAGYLIKNYFKEPKTTKQRGYLIKALSGCISIDNTYNILSKLELTDKEYMEIEKLFKYKTSEVRQAAIKLLSSREDSKLLESLERLIKNKKSETRVAALDILLSFKGKEDKKDVFEKGKELLKLIDNPEEQEKIIIQELLDSKKKELTLENGLGLFSDNDESKEFNINILDTPYGERYLEVLDSLKEESKSKENDSALKYVIKKAVSNITGEKKGISLVFSTPLKDLIKKLQKLNQIIEENKGFEYTTKNYSGEETTVVFGTGYYLQELDYKNRTSNVENLPLSHLWINYFNETLTKLELQAAMFLTQTSYIDKESGENSLSQKLYGFSVKEHTKKVREISNIRYIETILLNLYGRFITSEENFVIAHSIVEELYRNTKPEEIYSLVYDEETKNRREITITEKKEFNYWMRDLTAYKFDQKDNSEERSEEEKNRDNTLFIESFKIRYNFYLRHKKKERYYLTLNDFGKAYDLGLISLDSLYREILSCRSRDNISDLTAMNNRWRKIESQSLKDAGKEVVERILEIELNRGDSFTPVSGLARYINRFNGVEYFVKTLLALGKETFIRGYAYDSQCSKKNVLSSLLKSLYPRESDTISELKVLLKGKNIKNERLIEAAMYAPQWIPLVQEYIGWPGLKSCCYYFHAHVNEYFDEEKKNTIALYSPIAAEDFKNGAFDINWFREAYNEVGEERFNKIYSCAKYIGGGAVHKRAQNFADAVLGRMDLEDIKARIEDKRNKDLVLCYGLIPLSKNRNKDILDRYLFLQQFLKESKKFGAQRRESEGKAVKISLENLARNAGYEDSTRLSWSIETDMINTNKGYLEDKALLDYIVKVVILDKGKSKVVISKDNKELKTIPAKLKKDDYFIELQNFAKALRDQYRRAKSTLELAMEDSIEFNGDEVKKLNNNPVLQPLLENLLFKIGDKLGFIKDNNLVDEKGELFNIKDEDKVLIAHPVHLYNSGKWSNFQEVLFTNKTVQPFKQVFRELYLLNKDEDNGRNYTNRYEGYQIQPKKAVALLTGRRWLVNGEEGLQRVFYKEDIICKIYAMADWYSPSDIEAPTLETVEFYNRKTYEKVPLKDVPQIIFSEIMRDVDLVVSVAYVGAVDPEASLSTVDMRKEIIKLSTKLFKIDNLEFKEKNIIIKGDLATYTINLGSGVTHIMGKGSLYILPVHSQHRGRIFLPFLDEDPKTVEILSKVVMLAQDKKIKDPFIIEQIV